LQITKETSRIQSLSRTGNKGSAQEKQWIKGPTQSQNKKKHGKTLEIVRWPEARREHQARRHHRVIKKMPAEGKGGLKRRGGVRSRPNKEGTNVHRQDLACRKPRLGVTSNRRPERTDDVNQTRGKKSLRTETDRIVRERGGPERESPFRLGREELGED